MHMVITMQLLLLLSKQSIEIIYSVAHLIGNNISVCLTLFLIILGPENLFYPVAYKWLVLTMSQWNAVYQKWIQNMFFLYLSHLSCYVWYICCFCLEMRFVYHPWSYSFANLSHMFRLRSVAYCVCSTACEV